MFIKRKQFSVEQIVGVLKQATALIADICNDATKQMQWNASVSKNKLYIEPIPLQEVTACIRAFVVPVLPSSAAENLPILQWEPAVVRASIATRLRC